MKHRQEPAQIDPARVAHQGRARNQDERIEKREPKDDERRRDPEPIEIGSRRRRPDGEVRHRLRLE